MLLFIWGCIQLILRSAKDKMISWYIKTKEFKEGVLSFYRLYNVLYAIDSHYLYEYSWILYATLNISVGDNIVIIYNLETLTLNNSGLLGAWCKTSVFPSERPTLLQRLWQELHWELWTAFHLESSAFACQGLFQTNPLWKTQRLFSNRHYFSLVKKLRLLL